MYTWYIYLPVLGVEVFVGVFSFALNPWNPALKAAGWGEPEGVVESGFVPNTDLLPPVRLVNPDFPWPNVCGEKDSDLVVVVREKAGTLAAGFLSAESKHYLTIQKQTESEVITLIRFQIHCICTYNIHGYAYLLLIRTCTSTLCLEMFHHNLNRIF